MSIFPLSCVAIVGLLYAVFVAVVGDGTTVGVVGGKPVPFDVPPADFQVGVGEGIVCCMFPPGGRIPVTLVLTGWTIVVGVVQGMSISACDKIVFNVFDSVIAAPIGGVSVGIGIGEGIGTIGVCVGTTIGVGVGTIGVGVGTIGVGVGIIGVGVGTIGVGVGIIGVGVGTTGVFVAQPAFRVRATAS